MQCAFCGHVVPPGSNQCPRCGGTIAPSSAEVMLPGTGELVPPGTGELVPPGAGGLMPPGSGAPVSHVTGEVVPPFTGEVVPPFTGDVVMPAPPATGQVFSSTALPMGYGEPGASSEPPTARDGMPQTGVSSSAPQDSSPPQRTFGPADPQAELHTVMVSTKDRQETIETRLVEAPPPAPAPVRPEKKGLPDSRVARGVEDSMVEIKRQLFRFGRIGRLAFYSHAIVVLGAVCPWYYVAHQGYTPGIEGWGVLPLGLSLASIGLLIMRHRPKPTFRVLPVMFHLLLAAGLVIAVLWRYQVARDTSPHLRPDLAFGFYVSAVGALGAFLGALIGLKDVR